MGEQCLSTDKDTLYMNKFIIIIIIIIIIISISISIHNLCEPVSVAGICIQYYNASMVI